MRKLLFPRDGLTGNQLILLVSVFLVVFGNLTFFSNVLAAFPLSTGNALAVLSLVIVFGGAAALLFGLTCFGRSTKPVLIVVLVLSALAAYFMDSYSIVLTDEMLNNVFQTNSAEAGDLINVRLLTYLALLGILPAVAVAKAPLRWRGARSEIVARLKLLGAITLVMTATVLVFGSFYATFVREHKNLRTYANPTYYVYSAVKLAQSRFATRAPLTLARIGTDARISPRDNTRDLIILVVGETARADRFSLNGYHRETNPRLKQANVISFANFWACGTSTAISVPCMFSLGGEDLFNVNEVPYRENLLDAVQHAGANVLWLDNNSDSKGLATRVAYQSFKSAATNPMCDDECRDEGMISPLQNYIDTHPRGDIFIVLHQMGNHGPAYFKRYPPEFERFKPACKSNDLSKCSREEIDNAYDNAILYTDHFLAQVIGLLKRNSADFETAMLYVSDHGESLGENGVYLHGLPKALAPESQLHVPMIMWFGSDEIDAAGVRQASANRFSHDNLFHTVLGLMEIQTSIYRRESDILGPYRKRSH